MRQVHDAFRGTILGFHFYCTVSYGNLRPVKFAATAKNIPYVDAVTTE